MLQAACNDHPVKFDHPLLADRQTYTDADTSHSDFSVSVMSNPHPRQTPQDGPACVVFGVAM